MPKNLPNHHNHGLVPPHHLPNNSRPRLLPETDLAHRSTKSPFLHLQQPFCGNQTSLVSDLSIGDLGNFCVDCLFGIRIREPIASARRRLPRISPTRGMGASGALSIFSAHRLMGLRSLSWSHQCALTRGQRGRPERFAPAAGRRLP